MRLRILVTLVMGLILGVGSASAQSIGIFWDSGAGTCSTNQPANTGGTFYVIALLGGAASAGITGGEFRIDGFPSDWFPNVMPKPGATTIGSPFGNGGNIAFTCDMGTGGKVLLYTIGYFAPSFQSNRYLTIMAKIPPSNPSFDCPAVTLCDDPIFTELCVRGGQGIINGANCTVGVEQKTWSGVKNLYH